MTCLVLAACCWLVATGGACSTTLGAGSVRFGKPLALPTACIRFGSSCVVVSEAAITDLDWTWTGSHASWKRDTVAQGEWGGRGASGRGRDAAAADAFVSLTAAAAAGCIRHTADARPTAAAALERSSPVGSCKAGGSEQGGGTRLAAAPLPPLAALKPSSPKSPCLCPKPLGLPGPGWPASTLASALLSAGIFRPAALYPRACAHVYADADANANGHALHACIHALHASPSC